MLNDLIIINLLEIDLKRDYLLLGVLFLTCLYAIFAVLSCYMRSNFLDVKLLLFYLKK